MPSDVKDIWWHLFDDPDERHEVRLWSLRKLHREIKEFKNEKNTGNIDDSGDDSRNVNGSKH